MIGNGGWKDGCMYGIWGPIFPTPITPFILQLQIDPEISLVLLVSVHIFAYYKSREYHISSPGA